MLASWLANDFISLHSSTLIEGHYYQENEVRSLRQIWLGHMDDRRTRCGMRFVVALVRVHATCGIRLYYNKHVYSLERVPKVRATIIFVLRRGVIFILNGKRYLIIMHPRVRVFVLVLIFIQGCAFTCILKHIVFHLVSANTHTNWHKSAYYDDAVKKRGMSYPLV